MADRGGGVQECWYAILGVDQTATAEQVKVAYRQQALKWHPDKIQQSGASEAECQQATVRFQNIGQAYDVLSDPTERAWYDKHRSEILTSQNASQDFEFRVWSYFSSSVWTGFGESGNGFYAVYADVFRKVFEKEQAFSRAYAMPIPDEAPEIGGPGSTYSEVAAFYNYWQGFSTVKDFSWHDPYQMSQATTRKFRRFVEQENAKNRKKERREYNDTIRQLAAYVKKRDKRVLDRQVELQRLQKEKEQLLKLKQRQLQQEKLEKARLYEEQEWTKASDDIYDDHDDDGGSMDENKGSYNWNGASNGKKDSKSIENKNDDLHELYCIICNKRFRSEKQWKNHEKSKKHIERASALKQSFLDEDGSSINDGEREVMDSEAENCPFGEFRTGVHEESARNLLEKNQPQVVSNTSEHKCIHANKKPAASSTPKLSKECSVVDHDTDDGSEQESDEVSMLAAMMNSHKSRLQVSAVTVEESDGEAGYLSASKGDAVENATFNHDNQGDDHVSIEEGVTVNVNEDASSSSSEEESAEEEVYLVSQNPLTSSKRSSKRRARLEKKSSAARDRHVEITEELSLNSERSNSDRHSGHNGSPAPEGPIDLSEDTGSVHESIVNGKKKKSDASLKQQKSSKQVVAEGNKIAKASIPNGDKQSQKGLKKSKGKRVAMGASNTCETCGEDFDSRNQLFRHISATNHSVLKPK